MLKYINKGTSVVGGSGQFLILAVGSNTQAGIIINLLGNNITDEIVDNGSNISIMKIIQEYYIKH
jgi:hypothetical protein